MKTIITPGTTTYQAHCAECGAKFTYQREDVHHNYVRGGEEVSCLSCGHALRHFGASGTTWPAPQRRPHLWCRASALAIVLLSVACTQADSVTMTGWVCTVVGIDPADKLPATETVTLPSSAALDSTSACALAKTEAQMRGLTQVYCSQCKISGFTTPGVCPQGTGGCGGAGATSTTTVIVSCGKTDDPCGAGAPCCPGYTCFPAGCM